MSRREFSGERDLVADQIIQDQLDSRRNFDVEPNLLEKLNLKKIKAIDASPFIDAALDLYEDGNNDEIENCKKEKL